MMKELEDSINTDIMKLVVNLSGEGLTSDEDSDDELDEIETTINDIEDKAHELLAIQLHRYLKPRTEIEKAPKLSYFLLSFLDDKRFKQQF